MVARLYYIPLEKPVHSCYVKKSFADTSKEIGLLIVSKTSVRISTRVGQHPHLCSKLSSVEKYLFFYSRGVCVLLLRFIRDGAYRRQCWESVKKWGWKHRVEITCGIFIILTAGVAAKITIDNAAEARPRPPNVHHQ